MHKHRSRVQPQLWKISTSDNSHGSTLQLMVANHIATVTNVVTGELNKQSVATLREKKKPNRAFSHILHIVGLKIAFHWNLQYSCVFLHSEYNSKHQIILFSTGKHLCLTVPRQIEGASLIWRHFWICMAVQFWIRLNTQQLSSFLYFLD